MKFKHWHYWSYKAGKESHVKWHVPVSFFFVWIKNPQSSLEIDFARDLLETFGKPSVEYLLNLPIHNDDNDDEGDTQQSKRQEKPQRDEVMGKKTELHLHIVSKILVSSRAILPIPIDDVDKADIRENEEKMRRSAENRGLAVFPARVYKNTQPPEGDIEIPEDKKDYGFQKNLLKAVTALAEWSLNSSVDFVPATQYLVEVRSFFFSTSRVT